MTKYQGKISFILHVITVNLIITAKLSSLEISISKLIIWFAHGAFRKRTRRRRPERGIAGAGAADNICASCKGISVMKINPSHAAQSLAHREKLHLFWAVAERTPNLGHVRKHYHLKNLLWNDSPFYNTALHIFTILLVKHNWFNYKSYFVVADSSPSTDQPLTFCKHTRNKI